MADQWFSKWVPHQQHWHRPKNPAKNTDLGPRPEPVSPSGMLRVAQLSLCEPPRGLRTSTMGEPRYQRGEFWGEGPTGPCRADWHHKQVLAPQPTIGEGMHGDPLSVTPHEGTCQPRLRHPTSAGFPGATLSPRPCGPPRGAVGSGPVLQMGTLSRGALKRRPEASRLAASGWPGPWAGARRSPARPPLTACALGSSTTPAPARCWRCCASCGTTPWSTSAYTGRP